MDEIQTAKESEKAELENCLKLLQKKVREVDGEIMERHSKIIKG